MVESGPVDDNWRRFVWTGDDVLVKKPNKKPEDKPLSKEEEPSGSGKKFLDELDKELGKV